MGEEDPICPSRDLLNEGDEGDAEEVLYCTVKYCSRDAVPFLTKAPLLGCQYKRIGEWKWLSHDGILCRLLFVGEPA